jgi:DNA repair ATPase RecN
MRINAEVRQTRGRNWGRIVHNSEKCATTWHKIVKTWENMQKNCENLQKIRKNDEKIIQNMDEYKKSAKNVAQVKGDSYITRKKYVTNLQKYGNNLHKIRKQSVETLRKRCTKRTKYGSMRGRCQKCGRS